ncbi:ParB/RepB/Spo0J family partition protein [Micromonospora peucetia]|uniref:ParB-like nuclease domain-containing protein n=1 Tax=Micromonospora peucetia TaxID=47871 RepID=A0A1C6W4B0_9ACTN|nr:ParB/RepB/Spo0J family partition protein [Micromonospora peucetia]MCX4390199.1 ParB/RepB/Spo0J family partition protein [Micromonospora peucetia]WSA32490.1 ParB/RepB/Spo0J family partition protein [Micromonospora peucetia]SCL73358.1 ParB-like nuclease domain-containing protein [Micromonospora peucetia]
MRPEPGATNTVAARQNELAGTRIEEVLERIPGEVEWVDVALLRDGLSPRIDGIDGSHARHLAKLAEDLPPLVVHRATMRVMDGLHRLAAARSRGQRQVPVVYFEGTSEQAFVVAVRLNAIHGKALRAKDRAAAVRRILATHPHCSDRWIASVCGVAPRTVAALRQDSADDSPRLDTRIGRDGRRHPLSAREGRRMAEQIMCEEPDASLREVARRAGVSVGTALDVRRRLGTGIPEMISHTSGAARPAAGQWAEEDAGQLTVQRIREQLEWLAREPTLRYTDRGRALLRLVSATLAFLEQSGPMVDAAPEHCRRSLDAVARACAGGWLDLADQFGDDKAPSRMA